MRAPIDVLRQVFGFPDFRANQEEVCRAAISGRDVLLVMPTGAGKSLCYQLPALARGGTALVVSPLIALMEDQSSKLAALGLRVGRIHSGLDREASRAVCRDYLDGNLQFFFLAPERLRVPGFVEMLAKRKPNLIAIDEAHCISGWGHDFRPDYRLLGESLQALRPAPVIALTATATPVVQDDILNQLHLKNAARFIHGFRRKNLAIEAVEVSKPRRAQLARELLTREERRPAIVYAPTRKEAEETARVLGEAFPAAAYHAGLDPETRERIQRHFIEGAVQVVVATIAFGMGIDKADVRTVIHIALPAALEGYYQEIGRAGRDGKPSRTILMHSYADRRTHDFFYQRDYPELDILDRIVKSLKAEPRPADEVRDALKMDAEVFGKALDKLAAHGGAVIDFEGNVTRGNTTWRAPYSAQSSNRQAQVEKMMRFTEGARCRMAALIEHFGDEEDSGRLCGICDFCAPEQAIAQVFRPLTDLEQRTVMDVIRTLRGTRGSSVGKLHKQLFPREQMDRDEFETLLVSLARGGYATMEEATFETDGRTIPYRKVGLTSEGEELTETPPELLLPDASGTETQDRSRKPARSAKKSSSGKAAAPSSAAPADDETPFSPAEAEREKRLRAWRSGEAKKHGFPAFRIFGDKTLRAIVLERPRTMDDLLQISGIGPEKASRFGTEICSICTEG
ncbi:RecQ family ATP-dependent DNA helicase [Silvibacterium acidisoli]|uniref:RecQ family ATP-dependent DNA helicase n=1 Tax=Acidobacteriaceae bacterium ZG23-2 TaxID=2883246 RepID=UPI00406C1781